VTIRQSVLGEVALRSEGKVSGVDLASLLRRLLLFDTVVMQSVGLQEVAFLVRAFGKAGLSELLDSGVLRVVCEWQGLITDIHQNGVRHLPPFHFSFGRFEIGERDKKLRQGLISLQGVSGLGNAERTSLEEKILAKLIRPQPEYGEQLLAQVDLDIRNNTPALKAAIDQELTAQLGATGSFKTTVTETEPRVFRIDTDISRQFGVASEKTHSILGSAVAAVGRLDQRIADMQAYSSITGFTESEAPLLFGRLAGIVSPPNPSAIEDQFVRVFSIAGLPDYAQNRRIDVGRLLKVREADECREFRAWLAGSLEATDEQVAEMVKGVRNKVGTVLHGTTGKLVKFAAITALGMISGLMGFALGATAGGLDTFLTDKVFPNSGVVAFLSKTYPSLFEPPDH
jgi:hypothetical protein